MACRRHRRWLGLAGEATQHDLSAARDVLDADRRLSGLLARNSHRAWAWGEFITAWNVAQDFTEREPGRITAFTRRWRDRATALGITQAEKHPPRIVTFPEAVTLAALLTDLDWRRDVALDWDETPFYKHAARAIGEPSYSRWTLLNDPFRWWIRYHRARFEQVRLKLWSTPSPPAQDFR